MHIRNRKGFTLIEVVVVAGIIAILAGILVPMIFSQIDESKKTRALGDCKAISTAVLSFRKDMGLWPIYGSECSTGSITISEGNLPAFSANGWNSATQNGLQAVLVNVFNEPGQGCYSGKTSKSTYLNSFSQDPWGNAYVINSSDLGNDTAPIWVISAGPDGIIKTTTADTQPNYINDSDYDIGIRIR